MHTLLTSASIHTNWKMAVNCSKPPKAAQPPVVMLEEGSLANTSISIINWGRGGGKRRGRKEEEGEEGRGEKGKKRRGRRGRKGEEGGGGRGEEEGGKRREQ